MRTTLTFHPITSLFFSIIETSQPSTIGKRRLSGVEGDVITLTCLGKVFGIKLGKGESNFLPRQILKDFSLIFSARVI